MLLIPKCPMCDLPRVVRVVVVELVPYGEGSALLPVRVPAYRCEACDEEFSDWEAQEACEEAVRREQWEVTL